MVHLNNTQHTRNRLYDEISQNGTQIIRICENAWLRLLLRFKSGIDQKVINIRMMRTYVCVFKSISVQSHLNMNDDDNRKMYHVVCVCVHLSRYVS